MARCTIMVEVEITSGSVVTAQYGTLKAGDIVRTSQEFAAHLVNDCKAAKFREAPPSEEPIEEAKKPAKRK